MTSELVIIAIIISVVYGYRTQKNIGPMAGAFAFLIGCGVLGIKPRDLITALPMNVILNIIGVTFFFGFAIENGTLICITHRLLYVMRNHTHLMAIALFLICYLVAVLGAGISASAFLAPIAFYLTGQLGLNPLLAYTAVACGTVAGSNFMYSSGGIVVLGMIESTADYGDSAFYVTVVSFLLSSLICTFFFLVVYVRTKAWKCTWKMEDVPETLTQQQKVNLALIGLVAVVVIVPKLASEFIANPFLKHIAGQTDASLVMILGACVASILNLTDEKVVIRNRIPWPTIVMLGGVSLLVSVGKEAGLVEVLSHMIASSLPKAAIIPVLSLCGGLMSIFSSAISVVLPTLYPLVPILAATTGVSAPLMYSAIFVGATMTGISPLSTTGSMVLVGCKNDDKRNDLFYKVIILPFVMAAGVTLMYFLVQFI